jgi:XTP/dITP diphosphohydrolase
MKILIATKNKNKTKELLQILGDCGVELLTLQQFPDIADIPETGHTFEENALIKAKAVFGLFKIPVIADDSGLCVAALSDEPGVFSSRYAGEPPSNEKNMQKLLREVSVFAKPWLAKFVCSACYYDGASVINATGVLHGQIVAEKKGENGFGYDPVFVPDGYEKTLAQLTDDEKNAISHRGKAFASLIQTLKRHSILP